MAINHNHDYSLQTPVKGYVMGFMYGMINCVYLVPTSWAEILRCDQIALQNLLCVWIPISLLILPCRYSMIQDQSQQPHQFWNHAQVRLTAGISTGQWVYSVCQKTASKMQSCRPWEFCRDRARLLSVTGPSSGRTICMHETKPKLVWVEHEPTCPLPWPTCPILLRFAGKPVCTLFFN